MRRTMRGHKIYPMQTVDQARNIATLTHNFSVLENIRFFHRRDLDLVSSAYRQYRAILDKLRNGSEALSRTLQWFDTDLPSIPDSLTRARRAKSEKKATEEFWTAVRNLKSDISALQREGFRS